MFTPEDITVRLKVRPFVPLRLVLSTGQTYDVFHPDLVLVGRRDLTVGTASLDNPAHYDQITRVALMHVTEMRDLPIPNLSTGNGQSG